jgi:hypothetical protein
MPGWWAGICCMNHIEAQLTHRTDSTMPVRCHPLTRRNPRIGGILARLTAAACHVAAPSIFSHNGRCDASLKRRVATRRRAPLQRAGSPSSFGRGAIHPRPAPRFGRCKAVQPPGRFCQVYRVETLEADRRDPPRLPFSVTRMMSRCRGCRGCRTIERLN